jgi:uncharacterized protein (DUF1501 family)
MNPIAECRCLLRRDFLTSAASGAGLLALLTLLREKGALASAGQVPGVPQFPPKAKRCIYFTMEGGPSQFDLFAYKPKLQELAGQHIPASFYQGQRFAFTDPSKAVVLATDPSRTFKQYGQGGTWFSNLVPNIAGHADKICMLNSVVTHQFNHMPAQLLAETGNNLTGHPAIGAWLTYGLGSDNDNLPGYIVLNSSSFLSAGTLSWGSGFLPSTYAGVPLQPTGNPILNLALPPGVTSAAERRRLDTLAKLNAIHKAKMMDPEIQARIDNYELAYRMQTEAPALVDLSMESAATLNAYGVNRMDPAVNFADTSRKPAAGAYGTFAKHCLLARRMIEKGVRFVNIFTGSWDAHSGVNEETPFLAGMVDQPIAALLQDLNDRGLLDETLVVWGTEFGRTPIGETRFNPATGRDHHPDAFPMWLAGGGIKPGISVGATDEFGWGPASDADAIDISDVHATLLRLFGIDHMQLTYRWRGLDQRLTPVTRTSVVREDLIA